nr:hypothetical protein [Ktedonobacterales bacterium]
ELICAAQGLEFRAPLRPGRGVAEACAAVRVVVAPLEADRPPAPDIEALAEALRGGLLDALAPEAALDDTHTARRTTANGHRVPVEGRAAHNGDPSADRAGRGRH